MTCITEEGKKVFHCDSCPEHIETDCEDFKMGLIYMKRFGWRTYIGPDKEHAHACTVCVAQYAADQQAKAARK